MSSDLPDIEPGGGGSEVVAAAFEGVLRALAALMMFLLLVLLQALRVVLLIAPGLVRLAAVGAVIASACLTWPKVYAAYGGVPVSVLPAVCVILAPVAFALDVGARASLWGALVFAALATWGMGLAVPLLPVVVRGLTVVGVLVAVVFHFLNSSQGVTQDEQEIG